MKKRVILTVLMLHIILLLSACSGNEVVSYVETPSPSITGTWNLVQASGTISGQNYTEIMDLIKQTNGQYTLSFKDNGTVTSAFLINGEVSFSSVKNYSIDGNKITIGNSILEFSLSADTLTFQDSNASLKFTR